MRQRPLPIFLQELDACAPAVQWAKWRTLDKTTWDALERADWMLWFAARVGVERRRFVRTACAVAREAAHHAPAKSLDALDVVERWTRRESHSDIVAAALVAGEAMSDGKGRAGRLAAHAIYVAVDLASVLDLESMCNAERAEEIARCVCGAAAEAAEATTCMLGAGTAAREGMGRNMAILVRRLLPWSAMPWRVHAWQVGVSESERVGLNPVERAVLARLDENLTHGQRWGCFYGAQYVVAQRMADKGLLVPMSAGGFQLPGVGERFDPPDAPQRHEES